MLAGESFTDKPRCVDPVIGAYLRALNDRLDARRRQELLPYAARVVGTRHDDRPARDRRRQCRRLAGGRLKTAVRCGVRCGAGEAAAREVIAEDLDPLAFLDELIGSEAPALPLPVAPAAQERVPTLTA